MPEHLRRSFDELIDEAVSAPVEGWDFSFIAGRVETPELPWSYHRDAARLVSNARRVLDVDTGGGEVFASLVPPEASVAVEPHPPNVPVARRRLEPLGVKVLTRTGSVLPVGDGCFDLVLNRHGWLDLDETARVLEPGGRFLSQQVGASNGVEFNDVLGLEPTVHPAAPTAREDLDGQLKRAGFEARSVREAVLPSRFLDIGAVVFQLRAVPWQAPGFDVAKHRAQLEQIQDDILRTGAFVVRSERFLVRARKSASRCFG
jgi:SAM-dependent methyltransferase